MKYIDTCFSIDEICMTTISLHKYKKCAGNIFIDNIQNTMRKIVANKQSIPGKFFIHEMIQYRYL